MRRCGFCEGELEHLSGWDETGRDRAGNSRERDLFRCRGCRRELAHDVSERFSGNSEWWSVREGEGWRPLDEADWPM